MHRPAVDRGAHVADRTTGSRPPQLALLALTAGAPQPPLGEQRGECQGAEELR